MQALWQSISSLAVKTYDEEQKVFLIIKIYTTSIELAKKRKQENHLYHSHKLTLTLPTNAHH